MSRHGRSGHLVILSATVLLICPAFVSAHETKNVGSLKLTIGWSDEPAFTGIKNGIDVAVSDLAGAPVTDLADSFAVEVSFGDQRVALPLQPVHGRPGAFRAWLVPTRPGTYAFHFTGNARGQVIDVTSTCSATTFSCVSDVAELQFPAKDPSSGQLAERVTRTLPRTELAVDTAAGARTIALAAIAAAGLALAVTIGVAVRKGKTGR